MYTTTLDRRAVPPAVFTYAYGTGTSASAPLVAGAAALIWAQTPSLTNDDVKERLIATVDVVPSLVGRVVSNGRLNLRKALDNVAPGAIVDLQVQMGKTTAKLTWTAPGDNGSQGTAAAYSLRYSTSPITVANFASAVEAETDSPQQAGTLDCAVIEGLSICQQYYFAIRARDDVPNWSALSNVPIGQRCDSSEDEVSCP
jgi:hypothetical protein